MNSAAGRPSRHDAAGLAHAIDCIGAGKDFFRSRRQSDDLFREGKNHR
jgi:hypothetical protein